MVSPRFFLAVLVSAAVLTSCTSSRQSIDRNVRLFDELAFGGPFDNDLPQDKILVKWKSSVRISLIGDDAQKYASEVQRQVERISRTTGLSIGLHDLPTKDINYFIRFSKTSGYSIRNDIVPCTARVGIKNGVIDKAIIEISTADEKQVPKCIAHEMMHSFGFRFHSGISRSILSPVHGERDLTTWDELMLSTLYNPGLSLGQSRDATRPLLSGIIEILSNK